MNNKTWPEKRLIVFVFACLSFFTCNAQFAVQTVGVGDSTVLAVGGEKSVLTTIYQTTAVPALFITGGLLTFKDSKFMDRYDIQEERQEHIPQFRTHVDDYLQFAPIAAVYGLDLFNVKTKHDLVGQSLRLLTAELISQAIVLPLKKYTHIERPDGSDFRSFPSGHSTQAFVSATFMHKEFGHLSPWYSVGAYTTATAVGTLRMMNNKHWISDVLVGAGMGILSTNVAYLIFQNLETKEQGKNKVFLMPTYYQGVFGFNMICTIR